MRRFELSDEQWQRVKSLLPGQPGVRGGAPATIDCFWMPCYGPFARERRGVTCRNNLGAGTRPSNGSIAEPRRACGSGSSTHCKSLIWSG